MKHPRKHRVETCCCGGILLYVSTTLRGMTGISNVANDEKGKRILQRSATLATSTMLLRFLRCVHRTKRILKWMCYHLGRETPTGQ